LLLAQASLPRKEVMVNIDIPNDYTVSPSSATPHLTINRDVTIDLDSTNAFEGQLPLKSVYRAFV